MSTLISPAYIRPAVLSLFTFNVGFQMSRTSVQMTADSKAQIAYVINSTSLTIFPSNRSLFSISDVADLLFKFADLRSNSPNKPLFKFSKQTSVQIISFLINKVKLQFILINYKKILLCCHSFISFSVRICDQPVYYYSFISFSFRICNQPVYY